MEKCHVGIGITIKGKKKYKFEIFLKYWWKPISDIDVWNCLLELKPLYNCKILEILCPLVDGLDTKKSE